MSAFEKLLGELNAAQADTDTLAKSLTASDGGEGGEGGDAGGAGAGGEAGAGAEGGQGGEGGAAAGAAGEGQPMAKSFKLKLDDGTEIEATDGGELIKALQQRIDAGEETMVKAMGQALALIKSQGEMIKSLSEQVKKLSGEGRGRKTLLSIVEKPAAGEQPMAKGGEQGSGGMTAQEFMLKANSAFENRRISGKDLTVIDVSLRSGQAIDPALISKVVAA